MINRIVGIPFLRMAPGLLKPEPWSSQIAGESGPLAKEIPHWDYNVDLRIVRSVVVHESEIRLRCKLASEDALCAVVVWWSGGNNVRGRGCTIPLGNSFEPRELTLSAEIPGQMLSDDIEISTQLVLASAGNSKDTLAARFAGSVLWEDSVRVTLAGTGSRFPVEVVNLDDIHWMPWKATWFLEWNSDDLHIPFLRNVRLFVNASNAGVVAAIQTPNASAEHALIQSAIYCDVGRQLVRGALSCDEFVESSTTFAEGSTGRAIRNMIDVFFPGKTLDGLRAMMINRPEYFDGLIQGTLQLFKSKE
jgi:hypothetical protein